MKQLALQDDKCLTTTMSDPLHISNSHSSFSEIVYADTDVKYCDFDVNIKKNKSHST